MSSASSDLVEAAPSCKREEDAILQKQLAEVSAALEACKFQEVLLTI